MGVRMHRTAVRLACLAGAFAALLTIAAQARDQRRSNLGAKDVAETQTAERKGGASANDFGAELAAVARRQTSHLVFYNPAYMKIGYPMGDVPAYLGVCTDVVERSYRALGIDLQGRLRKTHAGSGHRHHDPH